MTGLSEPNINHLPGILGSLVVGLVSNLFSMITPALLKFAPSALPVSEPIMWPCRESGVKEIVLTGLATKPWFAPAVRRFLGKASGDFAVSSVRPF